MDNQLSRRDFIAEPPVTVAFGLGVDSWAMLIEMIARQMQIDLILFAFTGREKARTMAYLPIAQEYLARHGYPPVTVVQYKPVRATYNTLQDNCFQNGTLPSLAFGFQRKACSLKFKVSVQHNYVKAWAPAHECWGFDPRVRRKRGEVRVPKSRVIKYIGYDAGPADSRRAHDLKDDEFYTYRYFLRDLGWDRPRCIQRIAEAGLPPMIKSACPFCPATQPEELIWLAYEDPVQFREAIEMEDNARARGGLQKIEGLWGTSSKKRPGSWRRFAENNGLIIPRPDGGFDLAPLDPANKPIHPDLAIDSKVRPLTCQCAA